MSDLFDKDRPDPELPDEQQLDEYLRGGSAVSRQYRQLPNADVPAELDRLVLRQAQQAVKTQPAKSRKWMRWTAPLALAASAVLVVSIVIESGVHNHSYLTVPASAPVEMSMKQEVAEELAVGAAGEPPTEAKKAEAEDKASVVHVVPVQPAAPELAAPIVPEPAPFVADAPAPAMAPPPVAAPARAVAPQVQSAPIEEVQVRSSVDRRRESVQNSVSMPMTTARDEEEDLQQVVVTGMERSRSKQTAGPRNTVVPAAADSSRNSAQQETDEARNYSDPEQWLRDIRELRKQNKREAANREWQRFRYVFPNYEVAADDTARAQ